MVGFESGVLVPPCASDFPQREQLKQMVCQRFPNASPAAPIIGSVHAAHTPRSKGTARRTVAMASGKSMEEGTYERGRHTWRKQSMEEEGILLIVHGEEREEERTKPRMHTQCQTDPLLWSHLVEIPVHAASRQEGSLAREMREVHGEARSPSQVHRMPKRESQN